MSKLKIQKAIEDHVEVLVQYTANTTTDRATLKDMFIDIFCKFYKKEYFLQAVYLFNQRIHNCDDLIDWKISFKDALTVAFPENENFVTEIIEALTKQYKIK